MSGDYIALDMPTDLRSDSSATPFIVDRPSAQDGTQTKKFNITDLTVDIPSAYKPNLQHHAPPLWRTPEFFVYYCVFLIAVPVMIWIPISLSSCMCCLLRLIRKTVFDAYMQLRILITICTGEGCRLVGYLVVQL